MKNFCFKKVFFALSVCVLSSAAAFAQPGPPDDPDTPITGIEVLLGIGGFFGVKKMIADRKKK